MNTLLTAILYLWLALTILLAVMWFLREQDRRHKDRHENELEDELLAGSTATQPAAVGTAEVEEVEDVDVEVEPETEVAEAETETEVAEAETEPEAETEVAETEPEAAVAEPLPWSKNSNKRKKKGGQAKRSKAKPKAKPASKKSTTGEPSAEQDNKTVVAKPSGILDLLTGVTLPYDLTPLTARIEDPDRHAIFISPHPDAAEVGTAFADELVHQGFEIEPAGFDEALASRDEHSFTMRISPEAGKVADGSNLRYPSASETDVAIEVWIGNGSPPALSD